MRRVSSTFRSGPVLQLLPPQMTCPGRWGLVRWFASKSSMVCRSLFCLTASSLWPALVASPFTRVRCPYQVRRLFWSVMLRGHWPVFSLTLEVRTLSCHLILRMRLRFLESKLSIRFSIVWVKAHVSVPYKTLGTMMLLYRCIFTCMEKEILRPIFSILPIHYVSFMSTAWTLGAVYSWAYPL